MQNYAYMLAVTEPNTNSYYGQRAVNPERLENFKAAIESHIVALTTEVQTLRNHANWIEPRLNDYHKFMEWMQRVHPDVIEAYTQATKVEKVLDDAQGEMAYPQGAVA
jgi:hypothetical protein